MPISNFPNGFANGVNIRGVPLLNTYGGNVFWVDSGAGSDSNRGTFDRPFSTLDYAVGRCTANNGDIIMVKPGHAETVASAGAINVDVAGVTIFCLGEGASRPTFTFSATTSTITMTAESCAIIGFPILTPSIDDVASPLVISAANCRADIETKDASSAIEFIRAVLTTANADRLILNVRHVGTTGGNAGVNVVRLVGGNDVRVSLDAYGTFSTAAVEFHTTACTDVVVSGYVYNIGTTDGSKLVVDTVSGSTWYADINDGAAGAKFTGGSASALASDDVTAITNALYGSAGITTFPSAADPANGVSIAEVIRSIWDAQQGTNGITTFPSGAAAANNVSLAEVTRYIQDQVINGTGTVLPSNTSLYGVLAGATGIPAFPSAAAAANDVSVAEVLRYVQDRVAASMLNRNSTNYLSVTADFTSATWNTAAAHEIATVTGAVHLIILPQVTGTITSAGSAATLVLGDETTSNSIITSTDAENLAAGEWWFDSTDTRTLAVRSVFEKTDVVVGNGKDIGYTIGTEALTGGSIVFHMWWEPIDATGAVAAGAGGVL